MKEIWIARMPEYMGYGIAVISDSKEKAISVLKKDFYKTKKACNGEFNFKQASDYFGLEVWQVELNKAYDDNFNC